MNKEKVKKERITIYLDGDVLAYYRLLGVKEDRPYQWLINKALRTLLEEQVKQSSPIT